MHAPEVPGVSVERFELRGYRFHAWEQIAFPLRVWRLNPDVMYGPSMRLPVWQPAPAVVTVHDAMPWVLDEADWPAGPYRDRIVPAAFARAAAVVTDSESSRTDLVRLWPRLEPRLHVVPLGVGEAYLEPRAGARSDLFDRLGIVAPYLLYVGGDTPRKRLEWAIEVWRRFANRVHLVVCGTDRSRRDKLRAQLGAIADRVVFAPFVEERDMPLLYQRAAAVLYPTEYEGFGLPALEAQAVGTPVLFSQVAGLRELQGPGAVVLPANDMAAWVDAVESLVERRGADARPDETSRAWARGFSWDVYTEKMLAVYQSVRRPAATRAINATYAARG